MVFIINVTQLRITWGKYLREFSILGRPAGLDVGDCLGRALTWDFPILSYWPICGGSSPSP